MSRPEIVAVWAWEVLDSRGHPTVACEVRLDCGAHARAAVPSGASTGRHEAKELRDGGPRYAGKGVLAAVRNVTEVLGPAVVGMDCCDQQQIDRALRATDGSVDLSLLGANAVLSVSLACALAAAAANQVELYEWVGTEPLLPMPMINIISGGAHAQGTIDIQDLLIIPAGATSFSQALEWCSRVRRSTQEAAASRGLPAALVADEGGLGVPLPTNQAALSLLLEGIDRSGLAPGDEVGIALDIAATQLWHDGTYELARDNRRLSAEELVEDLVGWTSTYPVVSVEDALAEDDWDGWIIASERLGSQVQLVGDDLFATDEARLTRGIDAGVANAVLVKPNQTGTLSAAANVVATARKAGYATILSARSGETEDTWLADLAVGWRTGQIKVGSTTRAERTAKWNRLLWIERQLGDRAVFADRSVIATTGAS